jgi:TonB family protein
MIVALLLSALLVPQDAAGEMVIAGGPQPTRLAITTDGQGRVSACKAAQSSGDEAFDRLACDMVSACSREKDRSAKAIRACAQANMISVANDQFGPDAQQVGQ